HTRRHRLGGAREDSRGDRAPGRGRREVLDDAPHELGAARSRRDRPRRRLHTRRRTRRMTAATAVDVVVVGAGIAGASAAAELSVDRGVVLIERESLPAQHASGRSASVLSETSGHPAVCALARLSRPFFESPPPRFVEHALLRPRGLIWVGETGDEALLDELAARAALVAPTSRRLTAAGVRALLPTFADQAIAAGGVFEPNAMAIDAAALIDGYLRVLRVNGGRLATGAEAVTLGRHGDGWTVTTPTGEWQARHVVNAAGGWA